MTGGDGPLPRCKPFKYCYEKEIVMYAYFKKLDYFSTECTYSPFAARGCVLDVPLLSCYCWCHRYVLWTCLHASGFKPCDLPRDATSTLPMQMACRTLVLRACRGDSSFLWLAGTHVSLSRI